MIGKSGERLVSTEGTLIRDGESIAHIDVTCELNGSDISGEMTLPLEKILIGGEYELRLGEALLPAVITITNEVPHPTPFSQTKKATFSGRIF